MHGHRASFNLVMPQGMGDYHMSEGFIRELDAHNSHCPLRHGSSE
jgi:hypothetical protein